MWQNDDVLFQTLYTLCCANFSISIRRLCFHSFIMVSRASSLFFDTTQSWLAIADTNCACETLRPDQCENVSLPLVSTLSSLLRHQKLFGLYFLRLVTNVRNKCQIPCCDGDGCIKKIFRTSANIAAHAQDARCRLHNSGILLKWC